MKGASLGYTRLNRSRISGTMGHQLESLELSPWTRSIRAFQLQSGERHSYMCYLTEFPVAVFDSNRLSRLAVEVLLSTRA